MEALERLQAVHAHARLLHTHRIIATAHGPSHRFLAHFLLLLGESAKSSVEMERLCDFLVDAVPKMKASTLFDDMAHVNTSVSDSKPRSNFPEIQTAAEDKLEIENVTPHENLRNQRDHLHNNPQNLRISEVVDGHKIPAQQQRHASSEVGALNCMVSFKSMERARSTLEDFCRSYFMFHGMDVQNPIHVFRHLPLLVFVESYIYQLDEQNEDQLSLSPMVGGSKPSHKVSSKAASGLGRDPFAGLRAVLHELGLLTKRIEDELIDGVEYWRLERSLCTALSNREEVKIEDVLQALRLKSFDYRVLNLLLYGLRKEPVNESHYEFLSVSELLVEIADDLYDYEVVIMSIRHFLDVSCALYMLKVGLSRRKYVEKIGNDGKKKNHVYVQEDVGKNSFNALRMFLYIFGPREAPSMLAEFIGKSEDKYQDLLKELESSIQAKYKERCEEAVKEGGSKSVHVLGSWTIPSLISDEEAFRKQIM